MSRGRAVFELGRRSRAPWSSVATVESRLGSAPLHAVRFSDNRTVPLAKSHRSVFGWLVTAVIFVLALAGCHHAQPVAGTNPPAQSSPTGERPMPPADERPMLPAGERPMLVARIDTVSIYPVPGHTQDSAVSLMVAVGNAGFPSTVQRWGLEVTSLGQRFKAVGPVHIN